MHIIIGLILFVIIILIIKKICSLVVNGVKNVFNFTFNLIKNIFKFFVKLINLILAGPAKLCTILFYKITDFLHLQGFIYFILSIFSWASIIYLFVIHIPYSRKERFINARRFFTNRVKERNNTIGFSFFLNLQGYIFIFLPIATKASRNTIDIFSQFGLYYIIASIIYIVVKIVNWKKKNKLTYSHFIAWKKWTQKVVPAISEREIEERLQTLTSTLLANDKNDNPFVLDEIPQGRTLAFISYFNNYGFEDGEEPVYFSVEMSKNPEELREYGILITTKGLYISTENGKNVAIPFIGLYEIRKDGVNIFVDYGLLFEEWKIEKMPHSGLSIEADYLIDFLTQLENISLAMLQGNVETEIDEVLNAFTGVEDAEQSFISQHNTMSNASVIEEAGVFQGVVEGAKVYTNEIKDLMNGARGGGYASEYGSNTMDRITGHKVEPLAQDLENGRQKLHGADKRLDGINIQIKCYKSAEESIGAAFKKGKAVYLNEDGSMMQIEVPKDQYHKAVQVMKKRIERGEVPGETNPDNAPKYVRKGYFTYFQENNIAIAGSIEGLTVDALRGVVCSVPGASITMVLSFANAIWNGQDVKEAAKNSLYQGMKVIGKSVAIYTVTMQLSRDKLINIFAPKIMVGEKGKEVANSFGYVNNPVFAGAENVAKKISGSRLAKSKAGKMLKFDKLKGGHVIGGTVTAIVVFGPDICKAFQGKISGKQFIKNAATSTATIIGGFLGNAIPIPIVGPMAGAALAGFVAKKVLDNFIEDDAILMFKIMREEFLDIVMQFNLNKNEFNTVLSATIAHKDVPKILQNMYQSGSPKEYVDAFITAEMQVVLKKRKKITTTLLQSGIKMLSEESVIAS